MEQKLISEEDLTGSDKDCEMKRTTLDSPLGKLELSGCEQGLHRIIFLGKGTSAADAVEVPAPAAVLGGPEPLMQATAWLNAYFHQPEAIEEFPVPALHHPVFQQESFTRQVLWKLLKVVKFGEVISYSHLAALAGNPAATAAVKTALSGNPVPILIPCHRVVQGDLDVGGYEGGLAVKEWLLAHEGHRLGKPGLGGSGGSGSSETGPVAVDPTLRRRIEPHEFEVFFDPRELRKETCLLYEINWGGRHSIWRHTSQNTNKHVEVNFIEKFTTERYFCPNTRCSITWFLSWSPCGECSRAITEFLSRYPHVTLFIYIARLYHHADPRNRQGLRDLISSGVTIQIMTEQESGYCWRNFVNYSPSNEAHWPRYPHLWVRLYVLELYCIILGLPPCLNILRRKQPQLTFFTIALQSCHYQRLPPHILWATGLKGSGLKPREFSFVDLATLTMHRRNELEARIKIFSEKCDRAVDDINKLKSKTQGFVLQLNCDPSELKERFLNCMKHLDEYMYLITDFNLAVSMMDESSTVEYTPVHDTPLKPVPLSPLNTYNLIDALSEPCPSTSTACTNHCPPEKPKRVKTPKADQTLIVFSSTSSSEETVPQAKNAVAVKEVQCVLEEEVNNLKIEESPSPPTAEDSNLPAQTMLELDQGYEATIMHVDGAFFWVITDDTDDVQSLMEEMTKFYRENHKHISMKEVKALTCCAFYDEESDCYYRGLFLKLTEEDSQAAEIFVVDTGELRTAPIDCVQPLYSRFCDKPPYARCCHLAGVDLVSYHNTTLMEKHENFMKEFIGTNCSIEVDDKLVYLDKPVDDDPPVEPETPADADYDITQCPEYEDPVEAVTGYRSRDDADICKHFKGGPDKTCFKGKRCNKKHILKHPDGWTLDRIEVLGKVKSLPLPAPGSWHKVLVTCVAHYDRLFVQLVSDRTQEELPSFGCVVPLTTLAALVRDMNSPATKAAYKPLTVTPAEGELVAALYPPDCNWYRARVLSVQRADQSVEVMYIDYGTVLWVKEEQLRLLSARHTALPRQALRVALAGARAASPCSRQWARAKRALHDMALDKTFDAHVISRDYDEISAELFDADGYSVAEQLAAIHMVELTEYSVVDDTDVSHKIVVP